MISLSAQMLRRISLIKYALRASLALSLLVPASAQTGATLVSDTFNRADSASLGVSDTGQAWTVHAGTFSVQAGTARLGTGFALASLNAGSSTGAAQVRVAAISNEFWLILRLTDGANYWRFGRWQNGPYQLQQVQNNALGSPVIQTPATRTPLAGDLIRCELLTAGLECSVNGTVVASTANTFGGSATRMGLSGYIASSVVLDDFLVTSAAPAVSAPDISLGVQGPASGNAGATMAWTATVQNIGTGAAAGVELRVTQPTGQPNLSFTGATCTPVTNYYRCLLGSIAAQASVAVTIQLANVASASSVTIAATVPAVAGETVTTQNSASWTTRLRPAIPGDAIIIDRFDRPNGNLGSADTGQFWSQYTQPIIIQNGQAAPSDGFVLSSIQATLIPNQARVIVESPASEFWLLVRFENSSNYWRFGTTPGLAYQLQRVSNNSLDLTGITTLATVTPAAGDVVTCSLSLANVSCNVNGVAVASANSTAGGTALGVGLSAYQGSSARFDDFVATAAPAVPDLSISLAAPSTVYTSSPVSWAAEIRNQAVLAQTAEVVFTPPASVTQVQIPGFSCTASGATWRCALGSIAGGQAVSVRLDALTSVTAGQIVLSATVPVVSNEVLVTNNTASVTVDVTSPPSSGGGNPVLSDSFDRPDATGLGIANTGQTWSSHAGAFAIRSGQASPGDGFALTSVDAGAANLDVRVSLPTPAAEFWLILRFADSQNYWRFGRWQDQPYQLQRVVNGALGTPSVQALASVMPAAGDLLNCTTATTGINCFVNGVAVLRTTDSAGAAMTRIGLSAYQAGTARFDNLTATGAASTANATVSVSAPRHVLRGELHTVQVSVRNAGTSTSGTGTLSVTVPASIVVSSRPGNCTGQSSNNCSVSALASAAVQNFSFSMTSNEGTPFTGSAAVSVAGDAVASDNNVAWKTFTHVAGTSILDRFDRANTSSGLGNALSQQSWTSLASGFHISSGTARADAAGAFVHINTGYAFGTLEAVLGANPGTTAIAFRVVDANNYYRLSADASGFYALRKVINGVASPLALGNTRDSVTPAFGDRVRIVTRPDDGVFVSVNDVQVIDMGDPALMNATGWGMVSLGGPATVDEFSVNPKIEGYTTVDSFNVPDGSRLWQPTSGVKYRWIDWLGGPWEVTGQRAHGVSPDYTFTWIDTTSEQATVEAKLTNPGAGAWVIFRLDEANNTYFRFGHTGGTYGVQWMYRHVVNSMPAAVQTLASPTAQAGDVIKVTQFPDGTVECSVNGVVTHRFVDANTNARTTLYGLGAEGPVPTLDDFTVTPYSR